jgi:hypothetical protein
MVSSREERIECTRKTKQRSATRRNTMQHNASLRSTTIRLCDAKLHHDEPAETHKCNWLVTAAKSDSGSRHGI